MAHIETIDVAALAVLLPNGRLGMVLAQPYLSPTPTKPYRFIEQAELVLARQNCPHLGERAKLYLFSAIGLDGPVVDEIAVPAS